jgi:hypothetical protein
MSDEAYEVNGVPITSKPKRFRAGRSNNLGFQYAATNAADLAPVMVPDDNDLRFFAGEGEKSGAAGAMTATGGSADGKKRNFECTSTFALSCPFDYSLSLFFVSYRPFPALRHTAQTVTTRRISSFTAGAPPSPRRSRTSRFPCLAT